MTGRSAIRTFAEAASTVVTGPERTFVLEAANDRNERGLAVAQIRGGRLIIVDPAPRGFAGAGF